MNNWQITIENSIKRLQRLRGKDALQSVCSYLKNSISHYEWVGIYKMNPKINKLQLVCFEGSPTEHIEIEYGKGICGQVAKSGKALFVRDVQAETNYISCNVNVRSEVVFPIYQGSKLVAQIDIDSNELNPFGDEDARLLSEICGFIGENWSKYNS